MATEWLNDFEETLSEICIPCQPAVWFLGEPTPPLPPLYPTLLPYFVATVCGFTDPTPSFTLIGQSVEDNLNAWNLAHPENIVYFLGTPAQEATALAMIVTEIIKFEFGKDEICYEGADIFNTKEDFEVLNGLFIGRYAHKQLHDLHLIKTMKMWDML